MAKRMLIDATHPEETRVIVVSGNRLEEFDFETSTKKQLKGNIYLAKVTRVEPSLQAAFVDYGGNRHGFLAFNEIHPDYYRIPVADRQALIAEQVRDDIAGEPDLAEIREEPPASEEPPTNEASAGAAPELDKSHDETEMPAVPETISPAAETATPRDETSPYFDRPHDDPQGQLAIPIDPTAPPSEIVGSGPLPLVEPAPGANIATGNDGAVARRDVESVGGDDIDDVEQRPRFRPSRHYKIQEVIKRRQVLLVQVVKEERGTKGAALTTYLSLAGRYCVLMPNTARGGGISRRITSAQDRKRLKNVMEGLNVPEGMAVILRTAGMERNQTEIKRDYEYLMRMWDEIRELTLKSIAPALVYEEGSLIKRAMRDLYASDIEEILVEGEDGYKAARGFMKMLMPGHESRIRRYSDPAVPLLQRFQVESELDEIHNPTVRLKSGGYIVINPTEALVAIDVNSGRATRERDIEETALKTNIEAAEEIARQLRLRDLAGLIVIDFIDMDDHRHQHQVERRLKDAMKNDRARIQIGRISAFGLLELSRQRLRPSLVEASSERCPHCGGTGLIRSTESTALHVLRGIEEEGMKLRTAEAVVHAPTSVALYILNQKRAALAGIESRYGLRASIATDDALIPPAYRLDRVKQRSDAAAPVAPSPIRPIDDLLGPPESEALETGMMIPTDTNVQPARTDEPADGEGGRHRRRRRRGGRGRDQRANQAAGRPAETMPDAETAASDAPKPMPANDQVVRSADANQTPAGAENGEFEPGDDQSGGRRRRRRGRRGGRRRGRRGGEGQDYPADMAVVAEPSYPDANDSAPPVAQQQQQQRHPPRVRGPGDDLFPSRRVEGPGDAHDWPWNRRAERFPDDDGRETPAPAAKPPASAAEPSKSEEPRREAPPAPKPIAASPTTAAESLPTNSAGHQPPAAAEDPSASPRRGWWKRLTT